jgi:predicted DNA-binding transcriptional regulator AlpA
MASVPQRHGSTPMTHGTVPLSSPARSRAAGVGRLTAEVTPQALLPNASAATAFLESRARAKEIRPKGESMADSLQFLRVNDVCRLLRISKPTLWRLRRANAFPEPTELTDRVIAWRRSDVEAWLRARDQAGRASSIRASNSRRLELRDSTDSSGSVERPQLLSKPVARRRHKVTAPEGSDEQLILPLMTRD